MLLYDVIIIQDYRNWKSNCIQINFFPTTSVSCKNLKSIRSADEYKIHKCQWLHIIYIYREILYIKALANREDNVLKVIHDLFSVLFYSKSDRRQKIGDVCKTLFNDKC